MKREKLFIFSFIFFVFSIIDRHFFGGEAYQIFGTTAFVLFGIASSI